MLVFSKLITFVPIGELKLSEAELFVTLSVDVELKSLSPVVTTEVLLLVDVDEPLVLLKLLLSDALVLPLSLNDVEMLSLELKEAEADSLWLNDIETLSF